jgi:pseudoazurin
MRYILTLLITLWTGAALGADVTVEMLNKLDGEYMVYSKKIVHVDAGNTVFWKSVDKGHNVEFIKGGVPEGVEKFKSKLSQDTKYTFTIPGIYAYWCTPHKGMGMIGFVVVGGNKSNFDLIKQVKYFGKSKKVAKSLISQL